MAGDLEDGLRLGPVLRSLRRGADLSQRQLAVRAGVAQSTLAAIESGASTNPPFRTVERLVAACGSRLGVRAALQPIPHEEMRDEADRHYPAHLDVREVRDAKDWSAAWWTYWYNLPKSAWPLTAPAATFDLDRDRRNRRRLHAAARDAVIRGVEGLPPGRWRWVAALPSGETVGELRAVVVPVEPETTVRGEPAEEVSLEGLVVAPACRGAAVGRRLVVALADEMERYGVRTARAVTDVRLARFLRHCGFADEGGRMATMVLRRG